MLVCEFCNDRHQQWEGLVLVSLQNVEEVVILKEAHCSISYLQMNTSNALHNSLEEFGNELLNLLNLTDFQDLLEFSQE